jgi:hypothetical protein
VFFSGAEQVCMRWAGDGCRMKSSYDTQHGVIKKTDTDENLQVEYGDLGIIQRIDMIQKKSEKGEMFSRVFIHFSKWNDTDVAVQAKERILSGKDIKVIYDSPWFWKISANRSQLKPSSK